MDIGKVQPREIVEEMRESYLDYAMSVIVSRALPDVRDGLKPVHRRILFAMHEMGLGHTTKFTKCANIVGRVLGHYHPHGDVAVYDSLVRMAQDFSLRYPLINGQGNFGCFVKETEVQLTDGRDLSFGELIEEQKQGKRHFTFTSGEGNQIEIAEIHHPRLTRTNAELVKVTLDNGANITCTPDHRFMLRDGSYKPAHRLSQEDSLMPLYTKLYEGSDKNLRGYQQIYQPLSDKWVFAHHISDEFNVQRGIYERNRGRIRHHKDFNKLNNNPDNIQRMHWREHWETHYRITAERHQNDPVYRQKLAEGRKIFWANPENRARNAARISLRNKRNWQNSAYREHMRKFLSETNKEYIENHPEKRIELSKRATTTLKRLWKDPIYKQRMRANIIKGNKNHLTNKTGLVKFLNICSHLLQKNIPLDEEHYEITRDIIYPYGAATSWGTGLVKYFQGETSRVKETIRKNHRILSVEVLSEKGDVYDITIDTTHNFCLAAGVFVHNSIDGDSAAAYRYTEARMTRLAEELLRDIEKDTVDFRDNYDGTRREPSVLPSAIPNLLLNGTLGIAVGMATNIPPHNLGELVDALHHLIDHPKASTEDLTEFVKGPDFPTGGFVFNEKEIREAYASGKGAFLCRGKAEIQEGPKNMQIIITEIPYQVNKAELLETMANLVGEKKLEGIRDLRDESDKDGLRIAVELKQDSHPQKVLNNLYRYTDLEKNFNMNMIALIDGLQPQVLSLKDVLEEFVKHRNQVVIRRTQFDLARTKERIHILEGLKKALDHIDKVIDTIKKSADKDEAHANLMKKFGLTDIQSTAILEMRLQTLAGLERQKIEDELKEKMALARALEALLKDPRKIMEVIKKELVEIKEKYGDERRTKVVRTSPRELSDEDLIPEEESVVVLTRGGYIKRIKPESYRMQKRGGKGLIGMETKEEDMVDHMLTCNTHSQLLFFTDSGKVYESRAYEIPEGSRISKGRAIFNFLSINQQEKITSVLCVPKALKLKKGSRAAATTPLYIVMVTKNGIIKKVDANAFENVRKSGLIALTIKGGDALRWAKLTTGGDEIILVTQKGQAIRFSEKDVRAMGRQASGVISIRLKKEDEIVGAEVITKEMVVAGKLLVISENGYGKQTLLKQYKKQKRGGSGIKTAKVTSKIGDIVGAQIINEDVTELITISRKGQVIRTTLATIPVLGRATQGVRVMRLEDDKVASITTL